MHLTHLVLLIGLAGADRNLEFEEGTLSSWQGKGFTIHNLATGKPARHAASSADTATASTGLVYRTITLPQGAAVMTFAAAAYRPEGVVAEGVLDVVLEAAGREMVPREVKLGDKWLPAPHLLGPDGKQLLEYRWQVGKHAGKRVRIALMDADSRPGCHLVSAGFTLMTRNQINTREFARDMVRIQESHRLRHVTRYDSKHFLALSNANTIQSEYRLYNCETMYPLFFEHFRKKGFRLEEPTEKLMVAVFSTQEGVEAYLGEKLPSAVTGLYHTPSNRLLVYDFASNRVFKDSTKRAELEARSAVSDLERQRRLVSFSRQVKEMRDDANISTMMHEVAHQLSFNTGMLNREGDVPAWLAEGLATYCESTSKGVWQGIGSANPMRANVLAQALAGEKHLALIPLREMLCSDDWLRKAVRVDRVVVGYSQSWALFRLLMEERPKALKVYLETIYPRRIPDHRLEDFVTVFGDLTRLEKRYQAHLHAIARKEAVTARLTGR